MEKQKKYPMLETLSYLLQIAGWITLLFGIVNGVYIISENSGVAGFKLVNLLANIVSTLVSAVILLAASELINVITDIEYNTRTREKND